MAWLACLCKRTARCLTPSRTACQRAIRSTLVVQHTLVRSWTNRQVPMIELTCPRCRSKQAVLPADPNSLFCYYCRSVLTSDESIRRLADPDDSLNPSSPASTGTPPMRPRVAKPSRAGAPNIPTIEPSGIRPPPAKRRTRAASKQRQLIAVLGGLAAATIVSMVVVTVLFKEPLVSLPPGVNTKCSHPGCPCRLQEEFSRWLES